MTNPFNYDGTGRLGDALAQLYGLSPKSQPLIAAKIKQAKNTLGITSKAKVLPDNLRLDVYRWHYEQVHPATNEGVNIISQAEQPESVGQSVETISQTELPSLVDIVSQNEQGGDVEINSQATKGEAVEVFSQGDSVEILSQYDNNALVRIGFYVRRQGVRVRQVIALDGFYLNALMLATGITKQAVPKWVQSAVDGWAAFDSELPITKQVKYLLIRELTSHMTI